MRKPTKSNVTIAQFELASRKSKELTFKSTVSPELQL